MNTKKYGIPLIFIVLALFPPFFLSQYWLHVMIISLFYAMMASSWNLIAGYTGQISFAHAAFSGVGAYASGMLAVNLGVRSMARGSDRHRGCRPLGTGTRLSLYPDGRDLPLPHHTRFFRDFEDCHHQ